MHPLYQVWRLSEEELSDWHFILALSVGDCDWFIFLLLRGRSAEPHWCPSAATGHRTRWHCAFLGGNTDTCFFSGHVKLYVIITSCVVG